ncbi:unnamed protein product [Fraxinus pennsylvanica]|uniref:Uncharacterized protein n=1 Tax=Fraxinus pennsylvanica TaxID=56036 RepID=A0AAD2AIX3_9LAMI|nr:unnamed protein product [Fraxinus pennsylvanica]
MAQSMVACRYTPPSFSTFPILKLPPIQPPLAFRSSTKMMPLKSGATITSLDDSNDKNNTKTRKLPILLFDVMDTIVRDPFYHDIPAFFGMSMKELLECKHPTAWIEFEKGLINEMELARKFFKDGRSFDLEGLKSCMRKGYYYIEGVEELLQALKKNGYEMHAFTNYPIWYKIIEDKLKLSSYLSWTFCSCIMGKRKPDLDIYLDVLKHLKVEPANCVFVDDRMRNVEAAIDAGFIGLQFKNDINGPMEWEVARANIGQQFANSQPTNGGNEQRVVRRFLSQPTDGARQTGFGGSTSFVPKPRTNFNRKASVPQRRPRASGSLNSTLSEAWKNLMTNDAG